MTSSTIQVRGGKSARTSGKVIQLDKFRANRREVDIITKEAGIKGTKTTSKYKRRMKKLESRFTAAESDDSLLVTEMIRNMLAMSLSLVPAAEANVNKYSNERAIYAYNALLELCRQLGNDLKAQADHEAIVGRLNSNVIEPAMAQVLTQVATQFSQLKKQITSGIPPKKAAKLNKEIDRIVRESAKYVKEMSVSMTDRVRDNLIGGDD